MQDNRLHFRADNDLLEWLEARTKQLGCVSADLQARNDLKMLKDLLNAEIKRIPLTLQEASCIADVLNGALLDETVGSTVRYELEDAFQIADYATKWGIDQEVLLKKLSLVGPTADHALRCAIDQWWEDGHTITTEAFIAVGLRIIQ